jgi:hypothetical protein
MTDLPQTSPARHTKQGHDEMPQRSLVRLIEQGHEEMPQCSPSRHIEQGHDEMPHPCPTKQWPNDLPEPSQQARSIPKQGLPSEKEDVVAHQSEARKKIPYHTRPIFTPMENVSLIDKWFAHDQYKAENQVKEVHTRAFEPPDISKLHKEVKKYPNIDEIKWTKDVPKKYERGKHFLPNRVIAHATWNEKVP